MSRSYRKTVRMSVTERAQRKLWKRRAARAVRRYDELVQNGSYRKLYETWYIREVVTMYDDEADYVRVGLLYSDKTEQELRRDYRIHLRAK